MGRNVELSVYVFLSIMFIVVGLFGANNFPVLGGIFVLIGICFAGIVDRAMRK